MRILSLILNNLQFVIIVLIALKNTWDLYRNKDIHASNLASKLAFYIVILAVIFFVGYIFIDLENSPRTHIKATKTIYFLSTFGVSYIAYEGTRIILEKRIRKKSLDRELNNSIKLFNIAIALIVSLYAYMMGAMFLIDWQVGIAIIIYAIVALFMAKVADEYKKFPKH
jgi:uncharacterized membrane protein